MEISNGNLEGKGGLMISEFGDISKGRGWLKYGSRPWLDMDIFWNCPILSELSVKALLSRECTRSLF